MSQESTLKSSKSLDAALDANVETDEQSALRTQVVAADNLAAQQQLTKPTESQSAGEMSGPIARLFNRILGVDENRTDTMDMAFGKAQLREYLDSRLQLAEGEWFRGAKLDGVADKLMNVLDADSNGLVTWPEFQAFRLQILAQMAPGVNSSSTEEDIRAAAAVRFAELDAKNNNGALTFRELQKGTKSQLPKGTDHADLVAQLGARVALDAADTDQMSEDVADRELTYEEWMIAAVQLAFSG